MTHRTIGTWNVGNARNRELPDLLERYGPAALFVCEFSDQDDMLALVKRQTRYEAVRFAKQVGQPATAWLIDPEQLLVTNEWSFLLFEGGRIGTEKGTQHAKPKFHLMVQTVDPKARRRIRLSGVHAYADQHWNGAHALNQSAEVSRNMVRMAQWQARRRPGGHGPYTGHNVFTGDLNSNPFVATTAPLRQNGWVANSDVLGDVVTHPPGWEPDQLYVRTHNDVLTVSSQRAVRGTTSDHRPLLVTLNVRDRS